MKALFIFIITFSALLSGYSQNEIVNGGPPFSVFTDSLAAIRADIPTGTTGEETDPVWLSEKSGYATLPITIPPEADPAWSADKPNYATTTALTNGLANKQATLISGTNIKTVNGNTLLGSGDVAIAGGSAYTFVGSLAGDVATGANVTPVDLTGLVWTYAANSAYLFRWVGEVLPAATTTGCGFQLDVSSAVTNIDMRFSHQLANTGTLTGGSSRADDASVGVSSGMASASVPTAITGQGMLITGANTGTAQLRFRSETTAVTTCKTGLTLVVEKVR